MVDAIVEVMWRMLAGEQALGRTTTNADGSFALRYKPTLDRGVLIVCVVDEGGARLVEGSLAVTGSSDAAGERDDQEIDLVVPSSANDRASEWRDLVAAVEPYLGGQSPAELTDDQLGFLAVATERDPFALHRFADAHRLALEATAPPELIYGVLGEGLPGDPAALSAVGENTLKRAVEGAIAAGAISPGLRDGFDGSVVATRVRQPVSLLRPHVLYAKTVDAAGDSEVAGLVGSRLDVRLRDELKRMLGELSPALNRAVGLALLRLRWRRVADQQLAGVVGGLLAEAGRDAGPVSEIAAVRERVADAPARSVAEALGLELPLRDNPAVADDLARAKAVEYARLAGLGPDAARAVLEQNTALADGDSAALGPLVESGTMREADASAMRTVLELAKLSGDNLGLMRALEARGDASPLVLAGWDRSRWEALIDEEQIPVPPGETAASYADLMMRNLETVYPTQALAARVSDHALGSFFAGNPDLDLRAVNLVERGGNGATIDWTGVGEAARPEVEQRLRGYQRVLTLADTTSARATLLDRGYDSALKVVTAPQEQFVEASGLPAGEARLTYARAQQSAINVAHAYGAVNDVVKGLFKDFAVGNITPELVNDLRRIDGFDDLFGSQDYCDCAYCRSVLSPAAYFVDLMHFVEQHVSKPVFIDKKLTSHPLYLKTRRGDLWALKLTCENTQTLIPYLTIVNEVLEHFLNEVVGGDIYKTLADANEKVSFQVPISLPFAELRLYLSHFELAPADIYRTLRLPDAKVWRARLGLAPDEAAVVATPDAAGVLSRLGKTALPVDYPMADFLRSTGLTREQLTSLLALRFNPDLGNIKVSKDKTSKPGEIQNFPEILLNLTSARVDFIHRLLRLWRATGWELQGLDLVLLALQEQGLIGAGIDMTVIGRLGELLELQAALQLSVEELCGTVGPLPESPHPGPATPQADRRLYERQFNLEQLFGIDPATKEFNQAAAFHHYSLNTLNPNDTKIDAKTPFLLGALGITETELLLLFDLLQDEMQFSPAGDCTLNRSRLSLLYRHARVARALGLTIPDLIRALALLFPAPQSPVLDSPSKIQQLVSFRAWMGTAPFSPAELRFILAGDDTGPVKYAATLTTVAQMVGEIQKIPATDRINLGLRPRLAATYNVTSARLADMLAWAATQVTDPAIQTAVDTLLDPNTGAPANPAELDPLVRLVHQFERVNVQFTKLELTDETVTYVTAHPDALGIADLTRLALRDIRSLSFYRSLVTSRDAAEPDVQAVLDELGAAGTVTSDENRSRLADLWWADRSLIDSLVDVFLPLPAGSASIDALARLTEALEVCRTLGVNAYSLQKLGDDATPTALAAARDVALGAFSSKYDDEKVRADKLEPYLDQVNVLRRDAFCDYIIARQPLLKFADRSEIYNYFLLDVEMSGCFRISRVVAAISSVQLYIQRCLVNLEQSDPDLNPDLPKVEVKPSLIPAGQWEWRKNYRVWEANRKVFLFPESYLFPDLRDNKTPIFKELEDNLLQKKISKDSTSDAYHRYLTQFSEQAHLRICGSYYHSETDTYYFFGRTQQDPPVFYYRRWIGQTTWTPWEKIELAIDAPYVSAQIHLGRLFLFWVQSKTTQITKIKGGSQEGSYYEIEVDGTYSMLTPEGKWLSPQKLGQLQPVTQTEQAGESTPKAADGIADQLRLMELGKTYRKVYPYVTPIRLPGGDPAKSVTADVEPETYTSFGLVYSKAGMDFYDSELDLFHNILRLGYHDPSEHTSATTRAIVMATGDNSRARLAVRDILSKYEAQVDNGLQRPDTDTGPPYVTSEFSYRKPQAQQDHAIHVVQNRWSESVFTLGDQQYLIRGSHFFASDLGNGLVDYGGSGEVVSHELVRLSTSCADDLGELLMSQGLEAMLSLRAQRLAEKLLGMTITDVSELRPPVEERNHIDFRGAFGDYYREVFRDVPWLIAHDLSANQEFEVAKWWYERIFDPMSSESTTPKTDRNWRYIEFRGLTTPTLKEILTDPAAIKAYNEDPFNPHAIARLRPSAYQKAIVMQYVDNLLDWGDSLFSQDTIESINEATMLYVLASQILGKRPAKLGACDTAAADELTYEKLGPRIDKGSEFLITLENWSLAAASDRLMAKTQLAVLNNGAAATDGGSSALPASKSVAARGGLSAVRDGVLAASLRQPALRPFDSIVAERASRKYLLAPRNGDRAAGQLIHRDVTPSYPVPLVRQSALPAFCVPQNEELLKYWDRVEDRLYKIRHCMNISGIRRQLELFQPPIDPMALVRARAAGLSLEEALTELDAPVPPYRFTYLIGTARQAVQTVQSFGSALLSALEKKDVEELTRLRSVHEQTVLRMTKDVKTQQVREAQAMHQSLIEAKTNVENRVAYYQNLTAGGLTGWEVTQQVTRHAATVIRGIEGGLHLLAGIYYLIPNAGSPFAMTYGGKQLGTSGAEFAQWSQAMASVLEAVSASAGLEASFQRREEEWKQQLATAQQELKQIEQQRLAAEIRAGYAEQELEIHGTTIDQAGELDQFYRNKFTNLGLYNYLATTLTRLYREAYNVAYELATRAQRAYSFERSDDTKFVAGDNWQFDKAGLLAGERLALQLEQLESAYLKKNRRDYEMTQSFSLALVAPDALVRLRETGNCEFTLSELLFDLIYPGQYRRLIKSVRVTIPCVAGPYTNVSAKLTLTASHVRKAKTTGAADLVLLPVQERLELASAIATSSAQNDAGVFELNFRDERYLPFEGAGAVSSWRLELPSKLRAFDYNTISDVVIHMSYTALDDDVLRDQVETKIVGDLKTYASTEGLHRAFSLRHDFPDAFHLLLHPLTGASQIAEFDLGPEHFPYFLASLDLATSAVTLYLQPRGKTPVNTTGLQVTVNGTPAGIWTTPPMPNTTLRTASVPLSGPALKHWTAKVAAGKLDPKEISDLLLLVKYTAQ